MVERYGTSARVSMFRDPSGWCVAVHHTLSGKEETLFGRGANVHEALDNVTGSL